MSKITLVTVDEDLVEFAKQNPATLEEIEDAKNQLRELEKSEK